MAEKGRSTQSIVNSFPAWSNTRVDEQSLGYQSLNPIGRLFDDIQKQLSRIADNHFLPTSIISDIDLYYRLKLDTGFTFSKDDDDDTDFIFTPPTVSGVVGSITYDIQVADNNDIETFWYTPAPDRITLSTTVSGAHFIASGFIGKSPYTQNNPTSGLHIASHISITVDNGESFVGILGNGFIRKGIVQIRGKNREGLEIEEEIIFLHDETQHTINEFSEVYQSGLRAYGINDPTIATINFSSADFNQPDYPIGYDLDRTINDDDMPLFWALGSGEQAGIKTLNLRKYQVDELELRMEGWTDKDTILQLELLDTTGSGITPSDLTVEPHSNRIWVVDSESLYVYDNALPYPDLTGLNGKDYHAPSVIEPSSYYVIKGDEIEINYIWRRPVQGMTSHRSWVIQPDGTKYSLEEGSEVTYHTDSSSWIFGEPRLRQIKAPEFYTLNQRGTYVFCLEVRYTDDTSSIDKRAILVTSTQALAQFNLAPLGITTAQGVDFDSEENLWVLASGGYKHKINRHHDRMLIDFTRNIIYFREPYNQVQVY